MNSSSIDTLTRYFTSRRAAVAVLMLSAGQFLMTGCSETSPIESSAAGLRLPAAGSVFIYQARGTGMYGPIEYFDTTEVVRTGLKLGGRTNVIEMKSYRAHHRTNYTYMSTDASGNISFAECDGEIITPEHIPTTLFWVTFPLATKGMTTVSSPDSNIVNGVAQPAVTYQVHYRDAEVVDGGSLPIASAKFDRSTIYDFGSGDSWVSTRQYWISTSTGIISKIVDITEGDPGLVMEWVLVSQSIR